MDDAPRTVNPHKTKLSKALDVRREDLIFFQPGARRWVVLGAIGLCMLVFLIALALPAYDLSNGDTFPALSTFLMGWLGFAYPPGGLGWYANLFLPITWIAWVFSKFRLGLVSTIVGIGLAFFSMLLKTIMLDEAGATASITGMGSGFYVWLGSFGVCLAAGLALVGYEVLRRPASP